MFGLGGKMGSFGKFVCCRLRGGASGLAFECAADNIVARAGKVLLGKSFRINAKLCEMGGEG